MLDIQITSAARILAFFTLAAMIGLVLFVAYSFIDTSLAEAILLRQAPDLSVTSIDPVTLRMMMAVGLLAIAIQLYILNAIRTLFSLYSCGIYVSEQNGRAITQIGFGLIALPFTRFVMEPIWSILMTLGSDDISVSISISSTGIGLMLGGVLMLMIGRSMYQATQMRLENEAFV